jgi:hypothetical protein
MIRLAANIVLVLAVAWGGLWWYAEGRLHDALLAYAGRLTTPDGRSVFGYDSISKGTNPLSASATLNNVHWSLPAPGPNANGAISLSYVTAWIDVFNPLVMHVGLPQQIDISTPKGTVSLTFGTFAYSLGLDPRTVFDRKAYAVMSQNAEIQNLDMAVGSGGFPVLHIDDITAQETVNAAAGPGQTAVSGEDSVDGIALPASLVMLGHVPFGGKITHIGFDLTLSGPLDLAGLTQHLNPPQIETQDRTRLVIQTLHDWAAQGGSGKANLTLVVGPSTLTASGNMTFDAGAQPNGTADVTADHLDALTTALTAAYPRMQQSIANLEAQLSPYLATTDASGQVLTVHLAYGKPGVLVNGSRTANMPPLNWAALENPPAPPAQAPGDGSGAAAAGP